MKVSDAGVYAIALHEGIVPGPYRDSVGVWTWGIGHTVAAGLPDPARMARGMPNDLDKAIRDALAQFKADLAKYEGDVDRAVTTKISQHEFDALVSFHFNTGGIFRAQLTKALNAGDRAGAAKGFMSWLKPPEIKARREAERDLFVTGTYPGGAVNVWGVDSAGKVIWKPVRRLTMPQVLALMGKDAPVVVQPLPSKPVVDHKTASGATQVPDFPAAAPGLPGWLARLIAFFTGKGA